MKFYFNCVFFVAMASAFSQCSSTFKLQEKAPFAIKEVYFQKWVAGVKGGGSGMNVYIVSKENISNNIKLDSIYFREDKAKIEVDLSESNLFIGRFIFESNKKKDVIMSNDPNAEYGNVILKPKSKLPFNLEDNECVIRYTENEKIKYFKIQNVIEKRGIQYPGAKPKN